MKKLLGATLAIVMGATLVGGLAACNTNDDEKNADIAKKAISTVRAMYLDKAKETPATYTVIGQSKVDGTNYDVNWTATPAADCTIENFSSYVSVGAMAEDKLVTVSITKSTEMAINYKLNASVTVGNATESVSFDRTVPKSDLNVQTQSVEINLSTTSTRTSTSATQQIWEENGVKLTNDKGNSTTAVADVAPIRIYKSSSVKLEYPGMLQLVFHSNKAMGTSNYPAYLLQSLQADLGNVATITSDSTNADDPTVTVKLNNAVDILEFTANAGQIRLNKIDIDAVEGGATDADKVAVAKASLDLDTKNYTAVGTYDLPATKSGANISWAVSGTSDYVSIDGGKLKITSMPAADTDVTLTATISSGSVTDTKDITIKLIVISGLTNDGTLEHPYTPSQAKLVAKQTLAEGATAATEVYVKGYVIAPGTYNATFNNFDNMYIADVYAADKATTADDALYVYRPAPDGTYLTTEGFLKGDLVTFRGKLQNYKADVQELTSGTCVAREAAQRTDADIVADAKAALTLNEHYTTVQDVALPTEKNGATVSWALQAASDYASIDGNTLKITSLPTTDTTVTLVATISCGDANDTKEITIHLQQLALTHAGTAADPFTVADLETISAIVASGAYYTDGSAAKQVWVKAFIVDPGAFSTQYKNVSGVYIIDEFDVNKDKDSDGAFYVYRLAQDGTHITAEGSALGKGDEVVITGYIQNYNGKCQITYSGSNNASVVSRTAYVDDRNDDKKITDALAGVDATLSDITAVGDVVLPTPDDADVTFAWVSGNTAVATIVDGKLHVETLPAQDTEVTLTLTASCGTGTPQNKEVKVIVHPAGAGVTLDFVTNFATYGKDWGTSYTSHTVKFSDVGGDVNDTGTVVMSNANKQSSTATIIDRPVICAKNVAQYVTVIANTGKTITSVEFDLQQWGSKTFADIHIEYSTDGTTWTSCSDVIKTPGKLASTTLPAGVTQVRLSYIASGKSNTQAGLSAIKITYAS